MGKAAEKRRSYRVKYMSKLADTDFESFLREWDKRMDSWLLEIRKRAGILVDKNGNSMPPAFAVVKEAERLLQASGIRKDDFEDHRSINVLTNECCKVLASHIDSRLYQLNVKLQKK